MSESDLVLFDRWRHYRDAEAFAELVSRYADMVYATCRRVTGDAVAAEDVAQECFLKLAEGRAKVRTSVAGWLHSLATCRSLDRLRGEARRRRLEERFATEATAPVTIAWDDLQPHIDAAIEDLPERLREVIVRHFLHGETHAEVASRLGISRPAVTKSVARGVERIRAFLRRRGIAVGAVALAGLIADGAVEAAPESVRISLGKLAMSGVPEGSSITAAAGLSLTAKVVTILGGIALVVAVYTGLRAWPASAPPPAAIFPTTHHSAANESAIPTHPESVAPSSRIPAAREDISSPQMVTTKPATAVVRGLVRGEEVLPLAGASVQICDVSNIPSFSRKLFTAITKEDGTYEVNGIESTGKVVLRVAAEGYVDTVEGIELAEGELREGMDFNLSPGEALEGQVLSSSGAPLPGARVVLGRPRIFWSTKHADPNDNIAVCNEKGLFRIGVYKGRIEGETWNLDIVALGYGAGHFSGVTFPVGEIVPFQLQASATIRGHITWKSGAPAEGYAVRAKGLASTEQGMGFTAETGCRIDAQGTYEISDLPPGLPYVAYVERPDGRPAPKVEIHTPPLPSGGIQEWSPVMTTPIRVTGRAFIEGTGEPLNNYFVSACKSGVDGFSSRDFNLDGGDYELLFAEPGVHLIYPEYESAAVFEEWDTLKAYGKRVELHEGDDVRVDLFVPKAFVYPVRVTDTQGRPFPKAELQLCVVKPGGDESEARSTERKLDADGRYTWFCQPGKEVWFSAAAKGCHTETTTHRISEMGVSVPEETLVLGPTAGLLAHIILPEGVTESKGIVLRVTYPDGKSEDMYKTYFSGECQYRVPDAIRAGKVSVMAVEKDVDEPLVSQTVECTVEPGEIYDLGDLVMR